MDSKNPDKLLDLKNKESRPQTYTIQVPINKEAIFSNNKVDSTTVHTLTQHEQVSNIQVTQTTYRI